MEHRQSGSVLTLLPLGEITAEHIDEIFDTNVKGSISRPRKRCR